MDDITQFLLRHDELVLFTGVFAEQLGVPLPGLVLLLAVGALAGAGRVQPAAALGLAIAAAVLADLLWYELGRRGGRRTLGLVCRVSLDRDSCVRRTEAGFLRHGVRLLLVARFLPALGTVAAPLAGMVGIGWRRFLLYDGLGALLWAGGYMGLGYVLSDGIEASSGSASRMGLVIGLFLFGTLAAYCAYRSLHHRVLRGRQPVHRLPAAAVRDDCVDGTAHRPGRRLVSTSFSRSA